MSAIRTAVILAAGRGTRLAGELTDRPKGFIRIGTQPIVEESIERLLAAGIEDVIVVTGHQAEAIELARRVNPEIEVVRVSVKTDDGIEPWLRWLRRERRALIAAATATLERRLAELRDQLSAAE